MKWNEETANGMESKINGASTRRHGIVININGIYILEINNYVNGKSLKWGRQN